MGKTTSYVLGALLLLSASVVSEVVSGKVSKRLMRKENRKSLQIQGDANGGWSNEKPTQTLHEHGDLDYDDNKSTDEKDEHMNADKDLTGPCNRRRWGGDCATRRRAPSSGTMTMTEYDIAADLTCANSNKCTCDAGQVFTHSIGLEACKNRCLTNNNCNFVYCSGTMDQATCHCHEYPSCTSTRTPLNDGWNYKKTAQAPTPPPTPPPTPAPTPAPTPPPTPPPTPAPTPAEVAVDGTFQLGDPGSVDCPAGTLHLGGPNVPDPISYSHLDSTKVAKESEYGPKCAEAATFLGVTYNGNLMPLSGPNGCVEYVGSNSRYSGTLFWNPETDAPNIDYKKVCQGR